jgi:putative phosphoesterase
MARIGILSDTHDDANLIQGAIALFNEQCCTCIIHTGDFESAESLGYFHRRRSDAKFVWIAGDHDDKNLANLYQESQRVGGEFCASGEFALDGVRFGLCHDPANSRAYQLCKGNRYDFVLYGHWHFFNLRFGTPDHNTILLNPGGFYQKRHLPRTTCILDLNSDVVVVHIPENLGSDATGFRFREAFSIELRKRIAHAGECFAQLCDAAKATRAVPRNKKDGYWTGLYNDRIWPPEEPRSSWISLDDLIEGKADI